MPQLQPAGEQKHSKCAIGLPQAFVRKHTPGSGTGSHRMVETGECGDATVETRARPSSDVRWHAAFAELRYGIVARQHESDFKSGRNFKHTL